MDKATRALSLAEDHAIEIESLSAKLSERMKSMAIIGHGSSRGMSFDEVTSYGGAAIVVFSDGGKYDLKFCGNVVASSESPIFATLPPGTGELLLCAHRSNPRAVVIGAKSTGKIII